MSASPWVVTDELWSRIEPLLPVTQRRQRYPGRKRKISDRQAFCGILFVLHTGIAWEHLPKELGFGSGMTCWRRLHDWQQAGTWNKLHEALLAELNKEGLINMTYAVADGSHIQAKKGAKRPAPARLIAGAGVQSTTC